jgi:hypothetical protein
MAKKQKKDSTNEMVELIKKILMIGLYREGVSQNNIRKVVGGGIGEINKFFKFIPKKSNS